MPQVEKFLGGMVTIHRETREERREQNKEARENEQRVLNEISQATESGKTQGDIWPEIVELLEIQRQRTDLQISGLRTAVLLFNHPIASLRR